MEIKDIKIDDEFKNLLPPLSEDELKGLEEDIKNHGVLDPIILWNGFIADGHNRYSICKKLGITSVDTKELHKCSKAEVMEWIIDHQFARRNLTKSETVRSLAKVEQEYKKEASAKRRASQNNNSAKAVLVNLPKQEEPLHVSEKMAEKIGVSEKTYRNMRTIVNEGTPEQIERMDKGGKGNGVSAIANEIRDRKDGVPEGFRKCTKCGVVKPLLEFSTGNARHCNECIKESKRIADRSSKLKKQGLGELNKVAMMVKSEKVSNRSPEDETKDELKDMSARFVKNLEWLIKEKRFNKKDVVSVIDSLVKKIQEVKLYVEKS